MIGDTVAVQIGQRIVGQPVVVEVQADGVEPPVLAAAKTSASSGTALFGVVPRDAVPALLTVLASAAIAAVAGGNLRAWQVRRTATA